MARRKQKMPLLAQVIGLAYAIGQSSEKQQLDNARRREIAARTTDTKVRTQARLVDIQAKQAATKLKLAQAQEAISKAAYYDKMAALGQQIPENLPHNHVKMLECPKCRDMVVPGVAKICDNCHETLIETVLDVKQIR